MRYPDIIKFSFCHPINSHFIKFAFSDFHISIQVAHLLVTNPLSLPMSGAELVASHSQCERQPLQLLGSVYRVTSTTARISYAGHSSWSLVPCSSNHRSLHTSGQVSLESADVVVSELEEDHVTWVDLALTAGSPDDGFSKIRRWSYLLSEPVLVGAFESFFLRCPERSVSSEPFYAQDSFLATVPG